MTGVRAALQDGRPIEAAAWLAACTDRLEGIPDVAGAALAHGRGLVALAEGATGVARIALETAVAGWDRHGRTWEAAWARVDLAQCLVRSNRYAEAVTIGTEARALAQKLESPALAERADAVLRMARGHAPDDEPWRPLTSREFEVARLIGEGMTNARDRRDARHRTQDGEQPRRAHPCQARGVAARRDRDLGEQCPGPFDRSAQADRGAADPGLKPGRGEPGSSVERPMHGSTRRIDFANDACLARFRPLPVADRAR